MTYVSIAIVAAFGMGWEARRFYRNWRYERRQREYDAAGREMF
jgi:hypothetical protein